MVARLRARCPVAASVGARSQTFGLSRASSQTASESGVVESRRHVQSGRVLRGRLLSLHDGCLDSLARWLGWMACRSGEVGSAALLGSWLLLGAVRVGIRWGWLGRCGSWEVDAHGLVLAAFFDLAALGERAFVGLGWRLLDHE